MPLVLIWRLAMMALCALFVLMEPLVRAVLIPLALLSFVVTLVFGFLMGDPRFPKWGMLAFSIGSLWLYWLFLAAMGCVMRKTRGHD